MYRYVGLLDTRGTSLGRSLSILALSNLILAGKSITDRREARAELRLIRGFLDAMPVRGSFVFYSILSPLIQRRSDPTRKYINVYNVKRHVCCLARSGGATACLLTQCYYRYSSKGTSYKLLACFSVKT